MGYTYFRQGGVGTEDFEDEFRHVKSAKTKARPKKGCPGNDYNEHVYVWVAETRDAPWLSEDLFFEFYGFHKYEYKVCAGCDKRMKYRLSAEYTKKFKKEGHFGYEEYRDPGFVEFRNQHWRNRNF